MIQHLCLPLIPLVVARLSTCVAFCFHFCLHCRVCLPLPRLSLSTAPCRVCTVYAQAEARGRECGERQERKRLRPLRRGRRTRRRHEAVSACNSAAAAVVAAVATTTIIDVAVVV